MHDRHINASWSGVSEMSSFDANQAVGLYEEHGMACISADCRCAGLSVALEFLETPAS